MIHIKNLTKEYKQYTVRHTSLKSAFLNFKFKIRDRKKETKDALYAVHDLTLDIGTSEVFCITGPNGAGKSTLAKLLAGTVKPTSGSIEMKGKVIPFLELGVAFNIELTGLENLFLNGVLLGLSIGYLIKNKNKIFEFAEISNFMKTPLKYYSSGMQLRLAFSIAMHAKGDIYIFDEILAVGDSSFQKKCLDCFYNLIKEKKTIIVITHDIDFIRHHAEKLLILKPNGKHSLISDPNEIKTFDLEKFLSKK